MNIHVIESSRLDFSKSQLMVVWMAHIDGGAATLFGLVAMWGKVNKPLWDD